MSSFKRIRDGVGGRSVESRRFRRHCFSCRSFNELNEPPRRFRERVRTERQRMTVPRYVPMNQRNSSFLVEIPLPFSISWDATLPVYLRELVVHLFLPLLSSSWSPFSTTLPVKLVGFRSGFASTLPFVFSN